MFTYWAKKGSAHRVTVRPYCRERLKKERKKSFKKKKKKAGDWLRISDLYENQIEDTRMQVSFLSVFTSNSTAMNCNWKQWNPAWNETTLTSRASFGSASVYCRKASRIWSFRRPCASIVPGHFINFMPPLSISLTTLDWCHRFGNWDSKTGHINDKNTSKNKLSWR